MSLQAQQTFLARLFTDESLRHSFWQNPEKIGSENNLDENDIEKIKTILPEQLNFFADSLFYKRVQEVEKFLPLTMKVLNVIFINLFREFSQTFTPKTVKKHLEDSIMFVNYLQKQKLEDDWVKDLAKFEQSRVSFNGYEKLFIFCKFGYDIREILKEVIRKDAQAQAGFPKRKTFAVWFKIGKKTKHFIF
jgi:hypothetical protein